MLSDRERRELALIEQGLAGDRRLASVFAGGGAAGHRRWTVCALVGLGILMVAVGLAGADGLLTLQAC
jgi:hypothetical protein